MATKSNSTKQSTKKTTGAKTSSRSKNSTKSGAGSKSTRTKSGKATGQSKSRSGTKSSNKRKSSKNQKLIRYEIELVLLFAFTVLSALSLHSKSIGVAGEFISHVYLGLFGGTAYIVPYFLAVFIFLGINKNLKSVRRRYMTAFGTAFLAIILLLTVKSMEIILELLDFNSMTLTSFEGIQLTYKNGIAGQGGGVIGSIITFVFTELLGTIGTYFVIFVLFVIALVLGTRISILEIWEKRKVAAEKLSSIEVNLPEIHMPKLNSKPKSVKDARKQMKELKKSTSTHNIKSEIKEVKSHEPDKRSPIDGQHIEDMESHQVRESLRNKVRDFSAFDSDHQLDDQAITERTLPGHSFEEDASASTNVMGRPFTQEPVTESSVPESTGNESTGNESDYTSIRIVSDAQTSDPEDTDIPPSSIETDKGLSDSTKSYELADDSSMDGQDEIQSNEVHSVEPELSQTESSQNVDKDDDSEQVDDGASAYDDIPVTLLKEEDHLGHGDNFDESSGQNPGPLKQDQSQGAGANSASTQAQSSQESPQSSQAKKPDNQKLKNSDIDAGTKSSVESNIKKSVQVDYENYKLPPMTILNKVKAPKSAKDNQEVIEKAHKLEETLSHFGVEAKVTQISKGPTITMFELEPKPGTKVSKITNLSDDIALSLAAHQVRIVAPIPGKAAIGVEIPNEDKSMVGLRDVIDTEDFKKAKSKLTFALGKDISGKAIVSNLAKMPHMLIAGATGSGKSVCVNALISSILFNAKPDEVKFLMIDPKVVELSTYNGIPHLILPVVTDPKKASVALNWAVQEMTRRYQLFADTGVKDSDSYNRKAEKYNRILADDEKPREKLSKIVVIIDELADLMMVAPDQVEDAICRLAQMARAAGIHLIVATQRPSVDVITGIIKANIPSRIAFSVSSQTDSRTILDMAGAEKLLGQGDMLYYPTGQSKPKRIQGGIHF